MGLIEMSQLEVGDEFIVGNRRFVKTSMRGYLLGFINAAELNPADFPGMERNACHLNPHQMVVPA